MDREPRGQLSPADRGMIVGMLASGRTVREIAKEMRVNRSTVYYCAKRYREGDSSLETKPRSGRPRCTSSQEDQYVIQKAVKPLTAGELTSIRRSLAIECSYSTIRRRIQEAGILNRKPAKKPSVRRCDFKRNTKTGRLEEMPNNEDLQRQYPLQEIKPESIDIVEDDHSQSPFQEIKPDATNIVEDDHSQHLLLDIKQEPMEIVETVEDCSQPLQVFIKQEEVDPDSSSGDRSAEQFQGDENEPLQVFIKQEEVDADSNSGDRSAEQLQGDGNEVSFGPILLKYEVLPFGREDQPQEKSTESEANENLGRDISAATSMEDSIQESVVNETVPDGKRVEHTCHCHPEGVHSLHRTTKGVHGTNKENEETEDLLPRDDSLSSVLSPTTPVGQMRRKSVKRMHEKADEVLGLIKERFTKPNKSPFESLGKHWAEKMHSLRRQQRLFAEKLINDIFYEAEFGRLSYGCHIVSSPHHSLQYGSFPNSLPQTQQFCMPHPTFSQHCSAFLPHPAPAQTSDSPQSYPIPSPLPSVP